MISISNNICVSCTGDLTDWSYRYKGEHYCRPCYDETFKFRTCEKCFKKKKIHYALKVPICKFCQVKDIPCIRCGAIEYKPAKITEQGPVCNICVKYFVELKICSNCNKQVVNTSNRNLLDGSIKLLCNKCYTRTLPICSSCSYRRKPFTYTLKQLPLCKICSIEEFRECTLCNNKFPAGQGNICHECRDLKSLNKKIKFISSSLLDDMAIYFIQFSDWLINRRGLNFTSLNIQKYHKYFLDIDSIYEELGRLPTYEELVSNLSVVATRKNLSVTIFFDNKKLIVIDSITKDKYANIDMINRYLQEFKHNKYKYKLIKKYYEKLHSKLNNNKTTIRSIRLALTPAIKFLHYCDNFEEDKPNINMLEGYLWVYPGQRSSIYGFIEFLSDNFKLDISIKKVPIAILKRTTVSRQVLKQRFIDLLRMDDIEVKKQKKYLLKLAFGYLHGVDIPDNVYIDNKNIKRKENNYFIHVCGYDFYFPYRYILK